jgi:hypothetical protein
MILFVSMTLLVTVTYYISITQINSKTQDFKFSCAIQEMTSIEKVVNFVAWSPGSYQVHTVEDYGGTLKVLPAEKTLTLTLNGSDGFEDTVFNGSIGMIDYVLPATSIYRDNLFLEGDSRVLLNQSQATKFTCLRALKVTKSAFPTDPSRAPQAQTRTRDPLLTH